MSNFGVRNYDDGLGRFMSVDVLWEKYRSLTPYHYAHNNPVLGRDPNGMMTFIYYVTPAISHGLKEAFGHNAIGVSTNSENPNQNILYYPAGGDFVEGKDGQISEMGTIKHYVDNDRKVYRLAISLPDEAEDYLRETIAELNLGHGSVSGFCADQVYNLLVESYEATGVSRDEAETAVNKIFSHSLPFNTPTDKDELKKRGYEEKVEFEKEENDYKINTVTLKTQN